MMSVEMWFLICFLAVAGAYTIYWFVKLGKEKQLAMVKEWLLLAVVQAEKELGDGTGQVKLRLVYDMFTTKFKILSYVINFEKFSLLVDEALDIMRDMIENNIKVKNYIENK